MTADERKWVDDLGNEFKDAKMMELESWTAVYNRRERERRRAANIRGWSILTIVVLCWAIFLGVLTYPLWR